MIKYKIALNEQTYLKIKDTGNNNYEPTFKLQEITIFVARNNNICCFLTDYINFIIKSSF